MPYPTMTPATRARPNLGGSITRNGVRTNYAPSPGQNLDPNRAGSGGTITRSGVTRAYAGTPGHQAPSTAPSTAAMDFLRTGVDPQVSATAAAPAYNTYPGRSAAQRTTYDQFLASNPSSPAATGALATPAARAPYNPPQQTERANPLTGDNNIPPEGATTGLARAPFVQRGAGMPAGQDAMPAAIKTTETEDSDIGASMQGTMNRLRGTAPSPFARRFGQARKQSAYDGFLKRITA